MRLLKLVVLWSLLLANFSLIPMQVDPAAAQDSCAGLVPSRLQAGQNGRVVYDNDGIGVVFRDGPGKEQSGSRVIRALPEGTVVSLLRGPICVDAAIWWEVELPTAERGWVAEGDVAKYFIEPFIISVYVFEKDVTNTRQLNRWRVDADGNIRSRDFFTVPGGDATTAGAIWQEPDLLAANEALADRRANCPNVLTGTPWEAVTDAANVQVPEGEFDYYPSPDGGRLFLVRHRVVMMPACGTSPARYYGISTTHILSNQGVQDLFPFGQHNGARSTEACLSPDVSVLDWRTYLTQVSWSPDSDTIAITARYLAADNASRPCAYYYTFMIDVFSGQVTSIAEGRRIGWGEGGTRLYYFTQDTDNGYNILDEDFWQLSNGETTSIGLPEGSLPLPRAFDSTGVFLPWTDDGRQVLVCSGQNGCPSVYSFDIVGRQPSAAVPTPTEFQPFEVREVHYVTGDTRILWLTTRGEAYIQGLQGVDAGNWGKVPMDSLPAGITIIRVQVMPSGIYAILVLSNGEYALLNTVSRSVEPLGVLRERSAEVPAEDDTTTEPTEEATEATPAPTPTTEASGSDPAATEEAAN